jgi:WD40 repeat protein
MAGLGLSQDEDGPPQANDLRLVAQSSNVGGIKAASWSPDGNWVLTSDYGGSVKIWEAALGFLILSVQADPVELTSASFSPDGHTILTSGSKTSPRLWNTFTGKLVRMLAGGPNSKCGFTADGNIYEVSPSGGVTLFNSVGKAQPVSKSVVAQIVHMGPKNRMSSDGAKVLSIVNHVLAQQDVGGKTKPLVFGTGIASASYSQEDAFVVAGGVDGSLRTYDAASGKLLQTFGPNPWPVTTAAYSPDEKRLLAAGPKGGAEIWDMASSKVVALIPAMRASAGVSFSPDGANVMLAGGDGAEIWQSSGTHKVSDLVGDTPADHTLNFDLAGNRWTTSVNGKGRLWRLSDNQSLSASPTVGARRSPFPAGKLGLAHVLRSYRVNDHLGFVDLADGSSRLYELKKGKLLCTVWVLKDGSFAVVDPENRYDAPDDGHSGLLHWVRNGAAPMGLDQLRFAYYMPGLLMKILKGVKLPPIPK